jgi:hypothetical protein
MSNITVLMHRNLIKVSFMTTVVESGRSGIRIPASARNKSVMQEAQTDSGANKISYSVNTRVVSQD